MRQSGMEMLRFKNGKVTEHWTALEVLSFFQQLGVIPRVLKVE